MNKDVTQVRAEIDDHPLFGGDSTEGIVAVERCGTSDIRLYRRGVGRLVEETVGFQPWLITSSDVSSLRLSAQHEDLSGSAPYGKRLRFDSWSAWMESQRRIRDAGLGVIAYQSAAAQYLIDSGRGLFRGLEFAQLRRAQLDIETLSLSARDPDARIILITLSLNGEQAIVLRGDELSESEMLDAVVDWVHDHDPDVIEGHNLFNFDVPFLVQRAQHLGKHLSLGRDGSPVRVTTEQRFKVGARTIPYQGAFVYGRHLIDTYHQIQRYDTAGQLDSYALKPAISSLGMTRSDRTMVEVSDIASVWNENREELVRYAIDDVLDVNDLSELALPTEFYQARVVPRSLQSVATGGPGEKINDLLVRAYVAAGESIPAPSVPRDYPGGYAELRRTGSFSPVVKCDVESLYPSIMLADRIAPGADHLGAFLPMLEILTNRRLEAKRREQQSQGRERAQWTGIQSSLKVLINSFYGYLGYGRGFFNDYDAAERVTLRGQEIIQQIVVDLEQRGSQAIEIDTDGVFFQPPQPVRTLTDELRLIDETSKRLPSGIRLAHDGRYRGMLSLRLKNYALLDYEGRIVLKGSGLRSRRDERFLRRFVHDIVPRLLDPQRHGTARDYYLDLARQIVSGTLPPSDISRTETITEQTFRSESNRRLAEAVVGERIGERVSVYRRADGSLARTTEYRADEDRSYLLRRLRDMAERFRPAFDDPAVFDFTFPVITLRTNLDALRDSQHSKQMQLF